MSTVVKDLGAVSAYAYAVEKGYTGTEAEFAELMADYAEVGQRAEDAADSALESKTAAQTAATTATNKATEATTAAQTATTKAGEASTSASTATSAKDTAVSASQTATTKATEATTAAATATSAATTATTAKDDAVSAKTAAQTAQTGAETAAASVQSSAAQIATNTEDITQLKSDLTDAVGEGSPYETTYESGKYVRTDGTIGNYAGHSASWYIRLGDVRIIYVSNTSEESQYNAFYDSEYRFVSAFTTSNGNHIDVPNTAAFARVTKNNDDANFAVYPFPMTLVDLTNSAKALAFSKPSDLDYVTPQMFGAVGDGVHNDTTAIQAALDSGYKRIIIPRTEKYYLINNTLEISDPSMIIEGSSGIDFGDEGLPCIKANSSKWAVFRLSDNAKFLQIKNLKIDCNNLTNAGIYHDRTSNSFINDLFFENVFVEDAIDYGVYLGAVYKSTFINVRTVHGRYGIVLVGTSINYACTSCVFINCYTDYATTRGFELNNVVYSSMVSCATDHAPIAYSFTKCKGLAVMGCGCERCGTAILFVDSDQNSNVVINSFTQLLDAETSDYDATIYCGQVQNVSISGFVWSSDDHRPYLIRTTSQISSISILDSSVPPNKCIETKKGQIRFLYRDVVYDIASNPMVEGQIAISNGKAYVSIEENGSLAWKQISTSQ